MSKETIYIHRDYVGGAGAGVNIFLPSFMYSPCARTHIHPINFVLSSYITGVKEGRKMLTYLPCTLLLHKGGGVGKCLTFNTTIEKAVLWLTRREDSYTPYPLCIFVSMHEEGYSWVMQMHICWFFDVHMVIEWMFDVVNGMRTWWRYVLCAYVDWASAYLMQWMEWEWWMYVWVMCINVQNIELHILLDACI